MPARVYILVGALAVSFGLIGHHPPDYFAIAIAGATAGWLGFLVAVKSGAERRSFVRWLWSSRVVWPIPPRAKRTRSSYLMVPAPAYAAAGLFIALSITASAIPGSRSAQVLSIIGLAAGSALGRYWASQGRGSPLRGISVYLGLLEDDDAEFEISTRQRQLTAVLEERISTEAELLQIEEYLRSVRVNHRFSGVALLALHAEQGVRPGTAFSWALISLACLEGILSFETLVPETIHSAIRRSVVRGVAGIVVVGVALVSGLRTPAVSVAVEYGTLILLALPLAGLPPLKHVYPEGLAGRIARLLRSWVVFAHYEYVLAVVLMTFIVLPAWNRLLDLDGSWTRLFAARLFVDRNTASARGLLITPACVLLARNAASNYRQAFVQSGSLRRTAAEQADFAYGLLHSFVKPQLDNASHELEANGSAGRGPLRRAQAMLSDAMRQLQLGDPDYGETRDVLYTVLPRMDAGVRWNTNVGVATRDLSVADRQLMLFVVNDLVRNAEQANASSAQLSISRLPLGSDRESIEVGVTCDCGKNLDQSAPFRGLAQLQTRLQLRGGDLRLIPGSPHRWLASWPLTPTGRAL